MKQEAPVHAACPVQWPEMSSVTERVARQDVRYLCFESGGGKRVIYLGVVRALVEAAARISMSLPLIFKPMRITMSQARRLATPSRSERILSASDLAGVRVDGGYFNNLPQFASVHRPNGFQQTLGFSLSDYGARRNRIRTLADFLGAYAAFGLFGTGESQSGASTGVGPNTVQLVAGNPRFQIGLTDFAFRRADLISCARADLCRPRTDPELLSMIPI